MSLLDDLLYGFDAALEWPLDEEDDGAPARSTPTHPALGADDQAA